MSTPEEFAPAWVAAHSPEEDQLYRAFLKNREPFASLYAEHPELVPPDPKAPLAWGTGQYWDTTVARKHPYWRDVDLPGNPALRRRSVSAWGAAAAGESTAQDL